MNVAKVDSIAASVFGAFAGLKTRVELVGRAFTDYDDGTGMAETTESRAVLDGWVVRKDIAHSDPMEVKVLFRLKDWEAAWDAIRNDLKGRGLKLDPSRLRGPALTDTARFRADLGAEDPADQKVLSWGLHGYDAKVGFVESHWHQTDYECQVH